MAGKAFAVIGTFGFRETVKGFYVCDYDAQTGALSNPRHYDPDVSAGQQYYDPKRSVLYIVDECDGKPGTKGGGGFVRAYKFDRATGELTFMNERCALMTKPSYFWLNPTGDYALVSCHTGSQAVTKVVRLPDDSLTSVLIFEDTGVVLMRVNGDGSLGPVCDAVIYASHTPVADNYHAHNHSVVGSPDGGIVYACDKGLDNIHSYKIDRERGKIINMMDHQMELGTSPRYSVFHPTLPVWYENNERSNVVFAFNYDSATGALREINRVPLCADGYEKPSPSDIVITPDGRYVYANVRNADIIVGYAADKKTGALTRLFDVPSGAGPRGLCVSPDGRFLLAADTGDRCVKTFAIGRDGALADTGLVFPAGPAGNVQIIPGE